MDKMTENSETHAHSSQKKLFFSMLLTGIIFVAELIGGITTGSLALLSDSAHVFMDVFALGLGYLAIRAAAIPANDKHTYGFHRMQVLAALVNGITLLVISFEILREAIIRFSNPQPIETGLMLIIAVIGLVVNVIVALVLHEHEHKDLNTRAAFLHVISDTLASVGVIVAGVLIYFTGQLWIDPLVSILISLLVLVSAVRLLKETVHILSEGMPEGITAPQVSDSIKSIPGVLEVHDLHIWAISPDYIALSAHIILEDQTLSQTDVIMAKVKAALAEFGIHHTTIQLECRNCGQGRVCLDNEVQIKAQE